MRVEWTLYLLVVHQIYELNDNCTYIGYLIDLCVVEYIYCRFVSCQIRDVNHGAKGPTCKGGPIDKANLATNVSSKPNFLELVNANSTIPSFFNLQSTCDLNGMASNFVNSQLQNQLLNMQMNNMVYSLGNIFSRLQGWISQFNHWCMESFTTITSCASFANIIFIKARKPWTTWKVSNVP